jgi:hypothetical protein
MLLCCYAAMLLCCYAAMLLCCYAAMLLCCYAAMLLCCYAAYYNNKLLGILITLIAGGGLHLFSLLSALGAKI